MNAGGEEFRSATIELTVSLPPFWSANDVIEEIGELMDLSGQEDKPALLTGRVMGYHK